ncbi:MAG: NosD domain-containing protein [Candidatus Thorarchaeota archaeon]
MINNSVNNNIGTGLYLINCHDINVIGNVIYSNLRGIYLQDCDNGEIKGNTINNNLEIGLYLYYNSDYNEIKNNTINRNDLGIRIDISNYNNITGNILKDNNWCIYETYSVGNIIEDNDCSSAKVDLPIYIDDYATGVGAHNWTWAESQPWCSGTGTSLDPYIIENLIISGFGIERYGIDIRNSDVYFIIQECQIYNTADAGIYFDNVNNSLIINNNCSNNDNGIYIEYSNNITIFENIANDNRIDGIFGYEINYVNITKNTLNNNDDGICVNICNFSYFIENIANGNSQKGIYLEESFNNTISGNSVNNNDNGIFLWYFCYNNVISGNTANGNFDGIHLEDSDFNKIIENTVNDNNRAGIYLTRSEYNNIVENSAIGNFNGIFLEDENENNVITGNIFNNNEIGIELYYSDFNSIIDNIVNNNYYNGIEVEVGNYNTIIGNILKNNTIFGVYIETDSNNNSIYNNSFLENGKHAIDDGIDNKWNSTTIGNYWDNHTGPDNNNDGIVDIPYIYIGGTAGSIDYLPIAEYVPGAPNGLDPGVIAIIVVVSVMGGLAIIGVILRILLKRGKISLEKLKSFSFRKK